MMITKTLNELSQVFEHLGYSGVEWIKPPKWELGHIGVPMFRFAKEKSCSPPELANQVVKEAKDLPASVSELRAVGPYVNVFLNWEVLLKQTYSPDVLLDPFDKKSDLSPILIEYSSPNLAKPLGIHHLRGTIIGHVLGNLYTYCGYSVIRYNYLGDMGSAFGRLCVGVRALYGDTWKTRQYSMDELYAAYVGYEDHADEAAKGAFTKALEFKDESLIPFHDEVYKVTREAFEYVYEALGVHFDVWDGEFNYANQNKKLLPWLKKCKGISIVPSEGTQVLKFDNDEFPSLILIKSDKSSVYLVRDILSAQYRMNHYGVSKLLYVIGSEQSLHVKQLRKVLQCAKVLSHELEHIPYGLMKISGLKMSSRKGTVVMLQDVISQATEEMKKRMGQKGEIPQLDRVAKEVGVGALIFGQLFHGIDRNVEFKWEDIFNVEGDTGPYVYYAYARLSGILRKLELEDVERPHTFRLPIKAEPIHQLLFQLMHFRVTAQRALSDPSVFGRYLVELAKASNAFYHAYNISKETDANIRQTLLWVLKLAQSGLREGMKLLNMNALERL